MKYLFENFSGTILFTVISFVALVYYIVSAQQSAQPTAVTVGILSVVFGMGVGILMAVDKTSSG